MQNLERKWSVGSVYNFKHPRGYWEGDVKILGYGKDFLDEEIDAIYNYVEVQFANSRPLFARDTDGRVKLNAKCPWIFDEVNPSLENE